MTKLRVLVLSFPDFTDISIVLAKFGTFWKFLPISSYNKTKGKNLGPYHLNLNEKKERNRASFLRFFWRRHLGFGGCQ
jgi:hypothetical protein